MTKPTGMSDATAGPPATLREKAIVFLVMAAVLIVDQLTKNIIEANLPLGTAWEPFPAIAALFKITHVANTGAAFGLFPNGSLIFSAAAVIVTIFIIYYNHTLEGHQVWMRVALGLMMGGAIGNLIDRIRIGHVTDFLDFGPWPVFNVADMAVVGGVILMGWLMLLETRREQAQRAAER